MTSAVVESALTGLVFNIQRFSVHDGPGIRTTVFLKGCPLTCDWCSNPESQGFKPQLITRDIKCCGCGECVSLCPTGAISLDIKGVRQIDWDKCDHCLACVEGCLYESLLRCGESRDIADVMEEVMSDRLFYKNSGGGITVSGGEPLLHSKFVSALFRECKKEGIHTTLDTTGYIAWSKIQEVIPYVDLILWDVKHLDPEAHEQGTNVGNGLILENLQKAAELVPVWLRVPLIADYNDSEENIKGVRDLALKTGAKKVSLLPYHEGGRSKCDQIGESYRLSGAVAPTEERIAFLKDIFTKSGITVGIGN